MELVAINVKMVIIILIISVYLVMSHNVNIV